MGGLTIEEFLFIVYIVEFIVVFLSLFYLKQIPIRASSICISLLIFGVSALALFYLEPYMIIIIFFVSLFLLLLYYNFDFLKVSLSLGFIIFLGMISDHTAQLIYRNGKNALIHGILFVICYFILFFAFTLIFNLFKKSNSFSFSGMSKLLIIFLISITVIVLYLNIFIPTSYSEIQLTKINLVIQVSYLVVISVTLVLLVKNIQKENRLKNEQMQHDLFSQYMSSLEAINLDMQKFRHDYINILITMERYIENGDLDGLKTYFHDKILKTERVTLHKNALIKDLGNLDIIELKGLLLTKLLLALEKKLNIQVEIPEKVSNISMDIIDLSRIIGILIDNAIEASVESKDLFLNLAMINLSNKSTLIIIENSFDDATFDINKLYNGNFTTKNGNRGYGLKNVNDILKNYPNVLLQTSIENNVFIQEIEILK